MTSQSTGGLFLTVQRMNLAVLWFMALLGYRHITEKTIVENFTQHVAFKQWPVEWKDLKFKQYLLLILHIIFNILFRLRVD